MRKKMTKTDIAIRVLAVISVVMVIISVVTMSVYAYPSEGVVVQNITGKLSNEGVQKLLYYAEVYVDNQNNAREVCFITELENEYSVPYTKYMYRIYYAIPGWENTQIPEEWGQKGATLTFTKVGPYAMYYTEVCAYTINGQYRVGVSGAMTGRGTVAITTQNNTKTLKSNEQVVYMNIGSIGGYNDIRYGNTYEFGSEYNTWFNACKAYITGEGMEGGYTQEDINNARMEGYDEGYNQGYQLGKFDGEDVELDVPGVITSIPNAVSTIINGALGFEIFGINVAGTLMAILVVTIVAYIVKKVK